LDLAPDCNGVATTVSGSVTVSGTKTVVGRFTGNPAQPVVPDSDQPATFVVSAVATNFFVGVDGGNAFTIENGALSGSVAPRTALASDTLACSEATPNAILADVHLENADTVVRSASGTYALHVDDVSVDATNGVAGGNENSLAGTVTTGGETFTVPGDGEGLDPEYDAVAFVDSFSCNPDLVAGPVYACQLSIPTGIGAGQLTMRTLGTVAQILENATVAPCGFASAAVAGTPTFTGPAGVGDDGQTATFTIANACTVTLPADTPLGVDCNGTLTTAGGSFTVTGTKAVTGFQTGNPFNPIVPTVLAE
jgi:hypothetical protein